jgi:hypothetical protein
MAAVKSDYNVLKGIVSKHENVDVFFLLIVYLLLLIVGWA